MQNEERLIAELTEKCGLGKVTGEISTVTGGLMHKMYRVETETGVFAVKHLNPEIMKRADAMDNFRAAEQAELLLEENRIPIVPALTFGDRKMQELRGEYYYIFAWQEGSITDTENITREQCRIAGILLGRIHSIDVRAVEAEEPELCSIDFTGYAEIAVKQGNDIAGVLTDNLGLLTAAQCKLNEARKRLRGISCITDDDMDPKNVMWHNGEPHIIDLECLSRGDPYSSCIELSLQWAGMTNCNFSKDDLEAFFEGYLAEFGGSGFIAYDELYGIAYKWLEWLEYNIKRALGTECGSDEERGLGSAEVGKTINRIRYAYEREEEIRNTLKSIIGRQIK